MTQILYRLLLIGGAPLLLLYTSYLAWRNRSGLYWLQRYALGPWVKRIPRRSLWCHCASVGEFNTAYPLLQGWLERHPDDHIVVTSHTASSRQVILSKENPRLHHLYLPLDYPGLCRRFIRQLEPRCAYVFETELWLHCFDACCRQGVPLFILNGRLSIRTLRKRQLLKHYYRLCLSRVHTIYARSESDAEKFYLLGAPSGRVQVAANLKFAASLASDYPRLCQRPYILAASTHEGEESLVLTSWLEARMPQLLVVVPRHPERGQKIEQQLQKQATAAGRSMKLQRRSHSRAIHAETQIYIADTIGELPAWICHAELVFTGGSLVAVGGHNVLEAAQLGVPQITGAWTHNFSSEVACLQEVNGIIVCKNTTELAERLREYLDKPAEFSASAQRAKARIKQEQQGVVEKYLSIMEQTHQ